MGSNAKTLEQEILRLCRPHFNNAEPVRIMTVTKINDNSVDLKLIVGENEMPFTNVPVLKPAYGTSSMNLLLGDRVLVVFNQGKIASPIVIGKI